MSDVRLLLGDCLEILPTLPDKSVNAIITDLPYGTTACKWDVIIPLDKMWEQVKRICKGAFVTTASQPFTSVLIMSNLDWFKYEWIWRKTRPSGYAMAKHRPLKKHENIVVFSALPATPTSGETMPYYPQGLVYDPKISYRPNRKSRFNVSFGIRPSNKDEWIQEYTNYPDSILDISNPNNGGTHKTQKPVALYEYLIKTYTNEGDTVLDFCAGSGTTGVAAINTGRNAILIEREQQYFDIATRRIEAAQAQMVLPL